ncbi:hypothetical protein SFUMM280S_01514 [Streptomyces fumanus]
MCICTGWGCPPGVRDNEILTDTVTTYLGAGWLLLDAYREDAASSQKLGYLTPEEFGYVLAKRALVFDEDPSVWFTSPQAYTAYVRGRERALLDGRQPPLTAAGWAGRRRSRATGGTPRTAAPGRPGTCRTRSRRTGGGRCGCRSRVRPVISGSGCRCGGGCGRGAGCAGRCWSATRDTGRRGGATAPAPSSGRGQGAGAVRCSVRRCTGQSGVCQTARARSVGRIGAGRSLAPVR